MFSFVPREDLLFAQTQGGGDWPLSIVLERLCDKRRHTFEKRLRALAHSEMGALAGVPRFLHDLPHPRG